MDHQAVNDALTHKTAATLDRLSVLLTAAACPVVLCSFGKDSMVLLDLCRRVGDVDVLFFVQHAEQFPAKYRFAWETIQGWNLSCYTLPPRYSVHLDVEDHFEIYTVYGGDTTGPFVMSMGCQPRRGADPFVCAVEALDHPRASHVHYPWDLTLIGHKANDPVPFAHEMQFDQQQAMTPCGSTTLAFPLLNWSDADIWEYLHRHRVPYDARRYDEGDDVVNPDVFPTCSNCLTRKNRGQQVYCPKVSGMIPNRAMSDTYHQQVVTQLLTKLDYATTIAPKLASSPDTARWLDHEEEWPLFSVEKLIADDRVYLFVDHVVDVSTKSDGLLRLYEEWHRLERVCLHAGITGWVAGIDKTNPKLLRVVKAAGATVYHESPVETWLVKHVVQEGEAFPTFRDMARAALKEGRIHA